MRRDDGTLTPRQLVVLTMLARGMTPPDIAAHLFLSLDTVRWHIKRIYRNLGVHTRRDAIAFIKHPDGVSIRCPTCGAPVTRRA